MDGAMMEFFVQQLQSFKGNKDLSIRTTIVPDGALRGKVLIEVQSKVGFRLLDLPPELRKRIYEFVFAQDKDIQISTYYTHNPKGKDTPKIVCGPNFRSESRHKGLKWDSQKSKWLGGPPSELSLLQVNKQIHEEAAPVAYRSHCFCFKNDIGKRIDLFVQTIGTSVKHLGEVKLDKVTSMRQLGKVLRALHGAKGLHRLYLPEHVAALAIHALPRGKPGDKASTRSEIERAASTFYKIVKSFLLDRHKAYKQAKRSWKASEIIQFSRKSFAEVDEQTGQFQDFESAFRSMAKRDLGEA